MLTRRQLLLVAAIGAAFSARPASAAARAVSIALDWTPNTNHVGLFVAQAKGFYAEAGLAVQILPYTDSSASTLVANRVADFGITGSIALFTQRTAGADLMATYAVTQTETGRLVVNADRADITRPRDLDGLTYGGFGSAWENALIGTIIRHDGGKGEFRTVTLGTSAYQALADGAVDFTLEVYTWEGVAAKLQGRAQRAFRYADYGVPDEHTSLIASSGAYLEGNGGIASDFTAATRRGYAYAVAHPEEAADLLVAANSDALTDRALVRASMRELVDGHYLQTAAGVVGTIDPAKMQAIGDFLFEAGILRDAGGNPVGQRPDFSRYYTNTYMGG
ncbi:putative hydroxymethylpyrimidine transport system substrate-binding protein [Aquamicrobium terrae]